jgi:5-methylcytosine-specific restriction endonuclease McrA
MRAKLLRSLGQGLRALAQARDAKALSCLPSSVSYMKRYWSDPVFRNAERLRCRDRKMMRTMGIVPPADGSLTPEALTTLLANTSRCFYCAGAMTDRTKTLDHLVPLSAGGSHSILNAVVCCHRCNTAKGARHVARVLPDGSQLPLLAEVA